MLRVAFFGMGPIAAACLDAIRGAGHRVVGVTGYKIQNSVENDPLIATVRRDGLPLSLASGRSKEAMAFVSDLCPDILVSMYYRYILPGGMLRLAPHGGINIQQLDLWPANPETGPNNVSDCLDFLRPEGQTVVRNHGIPSLM